MFLQFANEQIKEFSEGEFRKANDGKTFEVSEQIGLALLKKQHFIGGEWVPVFAQTAENVTVDDITEPKLKAKKKEELLQIAADLNISDVTEDNNKAEIIEKILESKENNNADA